MRMILIFVIISNRNDNYSRNDDGNNGNVHNNHGMNYVNYDNSDINNYETIKEINYSYNNRKGYIKNLRIMIIFI